MIPRHDWHEAHKDDRETYPDIDVTSVQSTPAIVTNSLPSDDSNTMFQHSGAGPSWGQLYSTGPEMQTQATTSTTLVTSTSSAQPSAAPDHTGSSAMLGTLSSPGAYPTSSSSSDWEDGPFDYDGKQQGKSHVPMYVAAGVVPIVALTILGAVIFFCLKRRKKQRQIAAAQAKVREMKSRPVGNQPTVQAYMAPPIPLPRQPSYTAPPTHPPPPSPISPHPVILGPISADSSGNYMTGIDTSDVISVQNERTGLGDPFADGNSVLDEPPPPYRPRSIAPLSRDTSLRVAQQPVASSQTNLIAAQGAPPLSSPFDDPRDEEVVSDLSGPTVGRNRDDMSVVSDLSYQRDPTISRPGL